MRPLLYKEKITANCFICIETEKKTVRTSFWLSICKECKRCRRTYMRMNAWCKDIQKCRFGGSYARSGWHFTSDTFVMIIDYFIFRYYRQFKALFKGTEKIYHATNHFTHQKVNDERNIFLLFQTSTLIVYFFWHFFSAPTFCRGLRLELMII